jgi:hypothetical protein
MIKLIIGDTTHEFTTETFRRVLNAARHNLSVLEKHEAYSMPPVDHRALHLINVLQSDHKELI